MVNLIHSTIFITFSTLPLLINYFLKRKYKKLREELRDKDDYYHQCVFINMRNFNCKQHLIDRNECSEHCSYSQLKTLLNFISSAKSSICLCMFMLTLKQITTELIEAHDRGVRIRIITDAMMLKTDASKNNFLKLTQKGIPFKVAQYQPCMMHHKYCLIDKEDTKMAKVFFGSMNLTAQALVSNFDSVILTNNRKMIERFSEEFEEMWENFQPYII